MERWSGSRWSGALVDGREIGEIFLPRGAQLFEAPHGGQDPRLERRGRAVEGLDGALERPAHLREVLAEDREPLVQIAAATTDLGGAPRQPLLSGRATWIEPSARVSTTPRATRLPANLDPELEFQAIAAEVVPGDRVTYLGFSARRPASVSFGETLLNLRPFLLTDPMDNPVVATALEAQAEYVVTMDAADLLRLKVFTVSGHRPIQVVSPVDFLRLLRPVG